MSCHADVIDFVFVLSVSGGEGGNDDGVDYNDNRVSGGVGKGGLVEVGC